MVAAGENGTNAVEIEAGHERAALGFLDSAEAAFTHVDIYANRLSVLSTHGEYYESSGLTSRQIDTATTIGVRMAANAAAFREDNDSRPPHRVRISPDMLAMVDDYTGIDHDQISNIGFAERYRSAFIVPEPLPDDLLGLDARIEEAGLVAEGIPYPGDLHTILGLGTLRLAKFLRSDDVQARVQAHGAFSDKFRGEDTLYQAMQLTAQHLVDPHNFSLQAVLGDVLHGSRRLSSEQLAPITEAISDIMFSSELYMQYVLHTEEVFNQFGAMIGSGLTVAAGHSESLIRLQPHETDLADDPDANEELLRQESRIAAMTKTIERRARSLKQQTRSVDSTLATSLDSFGDEIEFTIADTPLRRIEQERLAAVRAGEFAAAKATMKQTAEQALAEVAGLTSRYFAGSKAVRRYPDGSRMASLLAVGHDGPLVWEHTVGPDMAFETAGLFVTLDKLMREQQNVDVFGGLFDAVRREDTLRHTLGARAPIKTLSEPVAWLVANADRLRRSPVETFRRIGDGLAAYRLAQNASPDRTKRPVRNVSVETLHKIEAIRDNAQQLEIEAFPPGPVNVHDLVDDVHEQVGTTRGTPPTLDEERLLVLGDLSEYYYANGFEDIQLFRLRPGSWRQKVPYYALVITLADRKVIVCENPKTPNSTVVLEEFNGAIGGAVTWEEMVQLNKDAVNEFGGRKMYHKHDTTLDDHVERVKEEVSARIITEPEARKR